MPRTVSNLHLDVFFIDVLNCMSVSFSVKLAVSQCAHTGVICSGVQYVIRRPGIFIVGQLTESVVSSFLIHQGGYHDLFVCL